MTPPAASRLPLVVQQTLDDYATTVLHCAPAVAHEGGVHLVAEPRRGLPAWHGYTLPIIGLNFHEGAVVACRPDLLAQLRTALGSDSRLPQVNQAALRRIGRALRQCAPNAFALTGDFRAAAGATFAPTSTMSRAELVDVDDPTALHLRAQFDGPVFAVRGPHGRLISWAALKLKSARVWEIAVATATDYRGRGYARDVVALATRHTLDAGRIPIYIHDEDNGSSRFVARAVGYQLYAEIVFVEY